MAEEKRQSIPEDQAPDTARTYERARPEDEAGMGRLDNNQAVPTDRPDETADAVKNRQEPRQINADQVTDERDEPREVPQSDATSPQPDHSMHEEEPLGWDQAPTDIDEPRRKRHSRKEGKGGLP